MKRWLSLMVWLGFVVAALVGLHRLGPDFPVDLIFDSGGAFEPALAAVARLIGLAVGYWLIGSTIVYLLAKAARLSAAIRATRWTTFGPLRRMVDGVLAGTVLATLSLPVTVGAITVSGYVPVPAGDATESPDTTATTSAELTDDSSSQERTSSGEDPAAVYLPIEPMPILEQELGEAPAPKTTASAEAIEVVVQPGDHMWALAEARLSEVRGRTVTDPEIAPYWLKVIGANLGTIRSGDPDLIFPGEVLVLPTPET